MVTIAWFVEKMIPEKNVQNIYFNQTVTDNFFWLIVGDGTVSIHNYGANSDEEHGWQSGEVNTTLMIMA